MQRFILRENINRFQKRLVAETDQATRRTLQSLLLDAQRQLAYADAVASGVEHRSLSPLRASDCVGRAGNIITQFQRDFEISRRPYLVLDPKPGLHIVDVNDAYGGATMTSRRRIAG